MDRFQVRADADNRSDAAAAVYRVRPGARVRERLSPSSRTRIAYGFAAVVAYLILAYLFLKLPAARDLAESFMPLLAGLGSLLLLAVSFLVPKDEIYLDRLTCVIPSRNLFTMQPRVLWSKVDEIRLVDLGKDEKKPDLALRLVESNGDEHDICLAALDAGATATLCDYIKRYCSHARGVAQLADIERFHEYQHQRLPGVSYTQLWESSAAVRFGLTSFTPLPPGKMLQERYRIERQIAAGGFSAVYLITDEEGMRFILKESVIPPNLEQDLKDKAQEQFAREARLLSRLDHSHIARVFDHFVEEGRNYLRLEYIEGETLRSHASAAALGSHGQPEAKVVDWLLQLSIILEYLHGLDPPVIHRDLSPDNIVVRPEGGVVLIDFGAANEFIGAATGTLVGKHAYMAPEQIRGAAEPRSDIYSLGALGYFALTGRDPEPIRSSSAIASGAPVTQWLDAFIKRATSLDKDERFQSASHCLSYLRKESD
ncbi:MAG: serine/threonine protein kinase [Candidatus Melainabacteria bacterium]|nr:serine/threonine protein kinase [Candidatus Melainabacteria bacterium]